jgi:hypothetical protein
VNGSLKVECLQQIQCVWTSEALRHGVSRADSVHLDLNKVNGKVIATRKEEDTFRQHTSPLRYPRQVMSPSVSI